MNVTYAGEVSKAWRRLVIYACTLLMGKKTSVTERELSDVSSTSLVGGGKLLWRVTVASSSSKLCHNTGTQCSTYH